MVSSFQSTLLLLVLTLTTTTAFAPTNNHASRTLHSSSTLHLLGNKERKPAKNHEEDMELTIAEIMKYAAKVDKDNVVDDDDEGAAGVTVGNLISDPKLEEVKSGGNPLKELGKKIKGKFNK